jgi:pyruvate dehydrogenase (quinone)
VTLEAAKDVPPLPPHITFTQAADFMSSMLKGDSDTPGMVAQSAKQVLSAFSSHGKK